MLKVVSAGIGCWILLCGISHAQEGDAMAGKGVFRKCAACHIAVSPTNKVGPHLMDIIDRPIASVETYKYSNAMIGFAEGDKVWDEALLRDFLSNPKAIVKGTRMTFRGLKSDKDKDNIIAYLRSLKND